MNRPDLNAMNCLELRGLKGCACLGVTSEERRRRQPIRINVKLYFDSAKAQRSDCLDDTIDYVRAQSLIEERLAQHEYNLIEALAEDLAATLFQHFPQLLALRLKLKKPKALKSARYSAFISTHYRNDYTGDARQNGND
ncbi:dihydroneopterin aldolase [Candidatus Sumerlaeota bacterium]|nr:dihydroneopterin aldolase [Candidatus Sumerlaeota bacterium]